MAVGSVNAAPSWLTLIWYAFGVGFGLSAGWGTAVVIITRGLPFLARALREGDATQKKRAGDVS